MRIKQRLFACWFTFLSLVVLSACVKPDPNEVRAKQGLPPLGFVGDVTEGREVFQRHCADCHGRDGHGSATGPALVHDVYEPSHHADYAFYQAAKHGVKRHHWQFGDMPPIGDVSPEEVAHIVAYIRHAQREAGIY